MWACLGNHLGPISDYKGQPRQAQQVAIMSFQQRWGHRMLALPRLWFQALLRAACIARGRRRTPDEREALKFELVEVPLPLLQSTGQRLEMTRTFRHKRRTKAVQVAQQLPGKLRYSHRRAAQRRSATLLRPMPRAQRRGEQLGLWRVLHWAGQRRQPVR